MATADFGNFWNSFDEKIFPRSGHVANSGKDR